MANTSKFRKGLFLAALVLVALVAYTFFHNDNQLAPEAIQEEEEPEIVILYDVYGINYENFKVDTGVVRNRQTLGHILAGYELSPRFIDRIVTEMREIFDPRRIRAGNSFQAYLTNDTLESLQYFVYDISAMDYLVFDLSDSLQIIRGEKEVTAVPGAASGVIYSSLWATLAQNNLNPELAIKMSEILAWEVDFYRIHRGDKFKVVYEENFVGEQSVGIGRVDAIYFEHHGREILGFKFEKDTVSGYFGPDGENLRKVFLAAPIKFGRISSGFSASRLHPVLGVRRPHYGTDYAAPTGTPIYAVGDGVVTEARFTSGNGNYVRIRHNSVYDTQYLHMSRFAAGMRPGVRVKQGDVIGYVGQTGLATGPHVCFRFWKNGQQVDHRREEFPSADPLHEDFFDEFHVVRDHFMEILQQVPLDEQIAAR
ncbi:MAG: peptidase M23 [Bacteroidetes bacterium]|nr:MAG: peptidase M23 [Bacteroidota bacterium]